MRCGSRVACYEVSATANNNVLIRMKNCYYNITMDTQFNQKTNLLFLYLTNFLFDQQNARRHPTNQKKLGQS
jgi:hypothetical protein